jgi:hypothetical protein
LPTKSGFHIVLLGSSTTTIINNNNNNNNNNNKWNVKTRVIPVIIGATGTISESFRKYVSTIPETMKLRNYRKLPY